MKLTEIKKKFKRWLFLTRLWFWAAVHSSEFQNCEFLIYRFPITVSVDRRSWGSTYLSISIEFNHIKWNMFIPSGVYSAFEKSCKIQDANEYITHTDVSDIPFSHANQQLSSNLPIKNSRKGDYFFVLSNNLHKEN